MHIILNYYKMDYDGAVNLITSYYGQQMDRLVQYLSRDAIIALGNLQQQGVKRQISDRTLMRLSAMEPHRQVGYLTNPLLEFLIQKCCNEVGVSSVPTAPGPSKVETKVNVPTPIVEIKPAPKPEPEPDIDDDVGMEFDIFG
jgi:hypothetical protein